MTTSRRRASVPGLVQAIEFALAALLAYVALHTRGSNGLALLAAAGSVAILAATAAGPLAIFGLLPARAHRRAMLLLSAMLVVAVFREGLAALPVSVPLAVAAAVLVRCALLLPVPPPGAAQPVSGAERASRPLPSASPALPTTAEIIGRKLGSLVADVQPALNRAARVAGRFAASQRAGKAPD